MSTSSNELSNISTILNRLVSKFKIEASEPEKEPEFHDEEGCAEEFSGSHEEEELSLEDELVSS